MSAALHAGRTAPPAARPSRFRGGRWVRAASCAVALAASQGGPALAQTAASTAAAAPRAVGAPHYGDTLFEFFQDKHFEALTGLMVSQHFGRVAPHDDDSEVLRGGLLLSYGMHREASELFARLIETHAAASVRDRAWFYLAKIRYQRGLAAEAEQALARIGGALPAPLAEERALLQAQLLMARADYVGAAAVLAALPGNAKEGAKDGMQGGAPYARFNLGVALVKAGGAEDAAKGQALLDQLGQLPAADEDARSLRDRANVALGFAALQDKRAADARRALQRVRLEGPQSNKALLGFGWAAAELGEPKAALVPWTELVARPLADAAVLEARIAVPYALAELGASAQVLARYHEAVDHFEGERKALDESIAAIRAGKLVAALLERNPGAGLGWFGSLTTLPPAARMPHGGHLAAVLASHEFQESFKNLRDLIFLGGNLERWQAKLVSFDDMLANRRQAFAERVPRVRAAAGAADLPAFQARRDALAGEIARAEAETDVATFADARQRDLRARIAQGEATLARAAAPGATAEPGTDLAAARERLRRVAGALAWELTQQFPDRLWQARKALRATDAALAAAADRDAALVRAQQEEPARFDAFAGRIGALAQRIAALMPRVAELQAEQAAQLAGIAVAELEGQKERLDVYALQARLAIAQLHDRAQLAQRKPEEAAR